MDRWNPKRHHSPAYYRAILDTIVHGLVAGWPLQTIRAALHGAELTSPTGGEWTEAALSGVLARMRQRKGPVYIALLEMHLEGRVSTYQVGRVLRSQI